MRFHRLTKTVPEEWKVICCFWVLIFEISFF
jgi:hypothetical protein